MPDRRIRQVRPSLRDPRAINKAVAGGVGQVLFDPLTLSPSDRWRAADMATSDGATVASWTDTGSAGRALTQGTDANRPVMRKTVAAINNRSAYEWRDATDNLITGTFSLTKPYTVWILVKFSATGSALTPVSSGNGSSCSFSKLATDVLRLNAGVALDTVTTLDTNWHLLEFISNGASSSIRIDNVSSASGTSGTNAWTTTEFFIGNTFTGHIAEILLWNNTTLTAGNRTDLVSYFNTYYGLVI